MTENGELSFSEIDAGCLFYLPKIQRSGKEKSYLPTFEMEVLFPSLRGVFCRIGPILVNIAFFALF